MNNIPNLTPEQIQALMLQQQILQNQMIQEANNPRGAFYQRLNMGNIPTGQGNQQIQNVNPNLLAVGNTEVVKNPNLLYNWSPAVFDNKYSQHTIDVGERARAKQQYEAALDMYKNANKK